MANFSERNCASLVSSKDTLFRTIRKQGWYATRFKECCVESGVHRGGSRKNRDIRIYDHAHMTTPKFLLCNPEMVLDFNRK